MSSKDNAETDGGQAVEEGVQQSQQRSSLSKSDDPYLLDGEEILFDARPAWTAWFPKLAFAVLVVLLGLISGEPGVIALTIIIGVLIVGYVAYQRMKVRYLVTDRRIIVATGISSKATNETWMVDVRGMQTGASLLERVLGHGHISVSTSIMPRGALLSFANLQAMTLGGISNYQKIAETVRQRQSELKDQS